MSRIFRIIVAEPPSILPITWRQRKSGNTTQRRQLLSQSRTPRQWHYVVDQDRDRTVGRFLRFELRVIEGRIFPCDDPLPFHGQRPFLSLQDVNLGSFL